MKNNLNQRALAAFIAFTVIVGSTAIGDITVGQAKLNSTKLRTSLGTYVAKPPLHIFNSSKIWPVGLSPAEIKAAYHLPANGGAGTIAIIAGYSSATLQKDLTLFSKTFGLASCTIANRCLTIHSMKTPPKSRPSGWQMETSLDVEWAHAIAPSAKILVVEAVGTTAQALLAAIDYARSKKGVVAVSMSWGGSEFPEETSLEKHFTGTTDALPIFFASSGDNGAGVSWPAVSPNVVAVGGTGLVMSRNTVLFEKAWSGSGGGVSLYEKEPSYQHDYRIPRAGGMRAIPDVAYNADPSLGFAVHYKSRWYTVGGTSAGAPQWAAIEALAYANGHTTTSSRLYIDKSQSNNTQYFRDIISGTNGTCRYYCDARRHYDYVTGLGSPLTAYF